MKIGNWKLKIENARAFTLIELLVVISIIGVLAGLTISVLGPMKRSQYIKTASAEMAFIETALDNYKAKYGAYPPANANNALLPQLYYELAGTSTNAGYFVTLDGSSSIPAGTVKPYYGVGGFVNCTRGNGEDDAKAKNFLVNIRQNQVYANWTNIVGGAPTTILITSVGGPDDNYHPLNPALNLGPNPFRYAYPGTNNPNGYDLWVQLQISGKKYLVCNWSRSAVVNSPLP
jgi:prepilin-type N-terminal cleavage/methylation domain-containing protein